MTITCTICERWLVGGWQGRITNRPNRQKQHLSPRKSTTPHRAYNMDMDIWRSSLVANSNESRGNKGITSLTRKRITQITHQMDDQNLGKVACHARLQWRKDVREKEWGIKKYRGVSSSSPGFLHFACGGNATWNHFAMDFLPFLHHLCFLRFCVHVLAKNWTHPSRYYRFTLQKPVCNVIDVRPAA